MTNTDTDFLHVLRQAEVRTTAAAIDRPTENNYSELTAGDAHRRTRGAARGPAAEKATFFIRGSFGAQEMDGPPGPTSTLQPNAQLRCQEPEPRSTRGHGG